MGSDASSDLFLLARIAAHDATALAALYDRHAHTLYSLICRLIPDESDAEAVLQDVFLGVWNQAEPYDSSRGSPLAWLARVARDRALERVRAQAPAATPLDDARGRPVNASANVAGALGRLPAEQRLLIEQAFVNGFTLSELAERFGLPVATVTTRIRDGMIALRESAQGAGNREQGAGLSQG